MGALTSKQGTLIVQKPRRRKSLLSFKRSSVKKLDLAFLGEDRKEKALTEESINNSSDPVDEENEEEIKKLSYIEANLEEVKVSVTDASQDLDKLNKISEKIEELIKELHKIDIKNAENEQRKNALEKEFFRTFQRLIKSKKLLIKANNPDHCWKAMDELENSINEHYENLNEKNCDDLTKHLKIMIKKLQSIDNVNDQIIERKASISDAMVKLEKKQTEIKMSQKMKTLEGEFEKVLAGLKTNLCDILDVSDEISNRKLSLKKKIYKLLIKTDSLPEIEKNIEKLRSQIRKFADVETSDEYFEMMEALTENGLALEELNCDDEEKKCELLDEINILQGDLDRTVSEVNELKSIEEAVEEIDNTNYQYSEEVLKRLKSDLLRLEVSQKLAVMKQECCKKIEECESRINLCF